MFKLIIIFHVLFLFFNVSSKPPPQVTPRENDKENRITPKRDDFNISTEKTTLKTTTSIKFQPNNTATTAKEVNLTTTRKDFTPKTTRKVQITSANMINSTFVTRQQPTKLPSTNLSISTEFENNSTTPSSNLSISTTKTELTTLNEHSTPDKRQNNRNISTTQSSRNTEKATTAALETTESTRATTKSSTKSHIQGTFIKL